MTAKRAIKTAASVGFILIAVAIVSAWNSPATGYESSIYWSTPLLAWGCLFFSIACGIAIIVYEAYRNDERSNLWVIGLILILLSNTIILSLHILRGYAMWNASGDNGTHLGNIQHVITYGDIYYGGAFYPITHIHMAQLSHILGSAPLTLTKWVPVFFPLFYIAFMYLLARYLLHGKRQVLLATTAATSMVILMLIGYSSGLTPFGLSCLFFPFALFTLFKSFSPRAWQWRALFLLTLLLFPLFHQVTTIALAVVLFSIPLAHLLFSKLARDKSQYVNIDSRFSIIAFLILAAWSYFWWLPLDEVAAGLSAEQFILPEEGMLIPSQVPTGASHLTKILAEVDYAQYYGYSLVVYFFKIYGAILVYILLALIALPILWKGIFRRKYISLSKLYFSLVFFALLIVALFFTSLPFGPLRFLVYIMMICTIAMGLTLSRLIAWAAPHDIRAIKIAGCFNLVLLAGVSLSAILTLYPSPYILHSNNQTTQTEIEGMNWFINDKDTSIYSAGWYYYPDRYADFLLTSEESEQRHDLEGNVTSQLPFHLGYDEHCTMGQVFEDDIYVVLREANRRHYVDIFPKMAELRLLPGDFDKMEDDPSLDKLYDNSSLDIWYVHAIE